jgi:hypothetical protein
MSLDSQNHILQSCNTTIVAEELLTREDITEIILSKSSINYDTLQPLIIGLSATQSRPKRLDLSNNLINFKPCENFTL